MPYLYKELDVQNKLQVAFCSSHCKIALIETYDGRYYVMHGSANMRSSANIEQFVFEEDENLYKFNQSYMDSIIDKYKTINKSILGGVLWQAVQGEADAKVQEPDGADQVRQNKDGAE